MLRIIFVAALAAVTPFVPQAGGAESGANGLVVENAWARAIVGGSDRSAGYATITNEGATAVRVIAAETPSAARTEIHETTIVDDVMRMRELEQGLEIEAGQSLTLEPGGLHIMFLEVSAPFGPGDSVPVRLILEDGGEIEVTFSVRASGDASSAADDHEHGGGAHGDDDHEHNGHGHNGHEHDH